MERQKWSMRRRGKERRKEGRMRRKDPSAAFSSPPWPSALSCACATQFGPHSKGNSQLLRRERDREGERERDVTAFLVCGCAHVTYL